MIQVALVLGVLVITQRMGTRASTVAVPTT